MKNAEFLGVQHYFLAGNCVEIKHCVVATN